MKPEYNRIAKHVKHVILLLSLLASACYAADWPQYRHDLSRSGVTEEQLPTPLHLQWTYVPAHRPKPAWPEPGRELNRVAFDYAYATAAAGGLVYFGSSADHKVYALDLATGRERWSFFTGGPVRFAPAVRDGRVFVASDDGYLYCLAASDGTMLWRFQGGPGQRKLIGNEQMISRWPLRSGVAVDGGVVYFSAGMWPSEGIYLYALSAETGEIVWKTVDTGAEYKKQPHPPAEAFLGVAPQGYVLGDRERLVVPTGRNMPAAYDRRTGEQLYYRSAPRDWGTRWGGSWCLLANGYLATWNCHIGPDIDVLKGEYEPDPADGMWFFDAGTCKELRELRGKLCAVVKQGVLYASGSGKLSAYDYDAWIKTVAPEPTPPPEWETPLKRTYTLIIAGDTLFAGGRGTVTAVALNGGKVLWEGQVDGQARCLAVADGRLLVSTTTGRVYCFGSQSAGTPLTVSREPDASHFLRDARSAPAAALARRVLSETGKTAGYCLVLGADDGFLLHALAAQSDLSIHCVEPDPARLRSVRLALDAAGLHGGRVVLHSGSPGKLEFPSYFADLVIAVHGSVGKLKRWPAAEVYRVLRPCGGRAYFAARAGLFGGTGRSIKRWLRRGAVPVEDIAVSDAAVHVTRGELPGADDWTHQYAGAGKAGASADTRARVPLEVLWFGKPGPAPMVTRHWRGPAPLYANGRMFVAGQRELICVDAYNGREIWRRKLRTKDGAPLNLARWPVDRAGNSVVVDRTSVYVAARKYCLRVDAATGKTLATYRIPEYPMSVPAEQVAATAWRYLSVLGNTVLGSMGEGNVGRCVFAIDKATGATRWVYPAVGSVGINALALDKTRVYLLDAASPEDLEKAKRRGQNVTSALALFALDAATGAPVWRVGENLGDGIDVRVAHDVVLVTGRTRVTGVSALTGTVLYSLDVGVPKAPVIVGDTIYIQPYAYELRTGKHRLTKHPFSGEDVPWTFTRSYGCGQVSGSPHLLMFRTATLGFYDLAGDTGTHNFAGLRAGCSTDTIAAGGLLLSAPADAGCTCSYSFRTTIALAAVERRDEWGLMYTRLPKTSVKRVALNLGAPGDRRDLDGTLWMAAPHPSVYNARPSYADPFQYEFSEGGGPHTSDPAAFTRQSEPRPWLYSTALRGLRKATFDLNIFQSGYLSWPAETPPAVDGQLTDACWDGYKTIPVEAEGATVTFRHDEQNLYLCYERPTVKDAAGQPQPWRAAVAQPDADVWLDHSFETYFSPLNKSWREPSRTCLHLGVSASGARYDALWTYVELTLPVFDIPQVEITVDGSADDWADKGLKMVSLPGPKGKFRAPANLDVSCRIGWNKKGAAVLVQVTDNVVREEPNPEQLWWGDSIEIFVTPEAGSKNYYQTAIGPGVDGKHTEVRHRYYDQRMDKKVSLTAEMAGRRTDAGYNLEMLLPWENLQIEPTEGGQFGLQLFVNDDDGKGRPDWFRARWHPQEHPSQKPSAFQTFRLATSPSAPVKFTRAATPGPDGLFAPVEPLPFPISAPPALGAKPEDRAYAGVWQSVVRTDERTFVAELSIPWATLTRAGVDRNTLMVDITGRGPLKEPPVRGKGFEPVVLVPEEATLPRSVTVRLHFAEVDDVKPGERVSDIRIQGQSVLGDLDVVKTTGGRNRPLVKHVTDVTVTRSLVLEIVPRAEGPGSGPAPISGIEILAEPQ